MNSPVSWRRPCLGLTDDNLRWSCDQRHRDEVFLDVVIEGGIERRGDGVMRGAHEEGVAVRRRLGGRRSADRAPGAGAVFDDDALAELGVELRRQRPRKGIGAAAGSEGHDEGDLFLRPLGVRARS